ncbi:MAG: ATP-binding cassette domain-containing protein, partial [Deltaproteobacteria bacterium]|nr:ATP-binding cassette domain-containing protein [Deltaproteobacteria bacterium]
FFDGVDISSDGLYARHEMGIGYLMQGGRVFPNLTVAENFLIATSHAIQRRHSKNAVLGSIFPALTGHASDRAGLLSGGQRQMLAIELAIEMTIAQGPVMLLLDEPAGGLTTNLSRHIIRQITQKIREFHWGALMVEQNITIVQEFCDRALRLKDGTVEVAPV